MGRLFWKLFLGFWLTLTVAGIAVGTAVWIHQQQRAQRAELPLAAGPRAEILVQSAAATLRFGGEPALRAFLEDESRGMPGAARVHAVDEQGRELLGREVSAETLASARARASRNGRGLGSPGRDAPDDGARRPSGPRGVRLVESPDGKRFLLFVPAVDASGVLAGSGPAGRESQRGPGRSAAMMWREPLPPWLGIAIGLLASLGFSALLAWYLTRPVRHLRRAFAEVAEGRLDARVGPLIGRRSDEIADLGTDFDRMAERLQRLIASQRRLLHDVSHELRSPLARLQAAIGLARQSPERTVAMLERIEREAERLDALVGELLTLARLEAGAPGTAATEAVDLAELVAEVVEDARFEARAAGRDVDFAAPDRPLPLADARPEWLQRAFENVVRNAIRFTTEGTAVEVALGRRADGAIVATIADHGPGVPADALEAIFEPFNRGPCASGTDGYGLGLAIAKRAVAAHGGAIAAANRPDGGLVVTITLPTRR